MDLARVLTSDFNGKVFGHHAVPGCQVSVDKLVGVEVRHAVSDLPRHLKHLLQRRKRQAGPLLLWKQARNEELYLLNILLEHFGFCKKN